MITRSSLNDFYENFKIISNDVVVSNYAYVQEEALFVHLNTSNKNIFAVSKFDHSIYEEIAILNRPEQSKFQK